MSWGEKKRVALAGVLARQTPVLLLDEPTAGLDPLGASSLLQLLRKLNQQQGLSLVLATHDLDLVPVYSHRVAVLHQGQFLAMGTPTEVFARPERLRQAGLRLPRVAHLCEVLGNEDDKENRHELPLTIGQARRWLQNNNLAKPSRRESLPPLTTGSCAAAAAVWLAQDRLPGETTLSLPGGEPVVVEVEVLHRQENWALCQVTKPENDDADVTAGAVVQARVTLRSEDNIVITGGEGVARATLPGLQAAPGEAAIKPGLRQLIMRNVAAYLPPGQGHPSRLYDPSFAHGFRGEES